MALEIEWTETAMLNKSQFQINKRMFGVAYFDRLSNTRYAAALKAFGLQLFLFRVKYLTEKQPF